MRSARVRTPFDKAVGINAPLEETRAYVLRDPRAGSPATLAAGPRF